MTVWFIIASIVTQWISHGIEYWCFITGDLQYTKHAFVKEDCTTFLPESYLSPQFLKGNKLCSLTINNKKKNYYLHGSLPFIEFIIKNSNLSMQASSCFVFLSLSLSLPILCTWFLICWPVYFKERDVMSSGEHAQQTE